jgi:hypothetical protein
MRGHNARAIPPAATLPWIIRLLRRAEYRQSRVERKSLATGKKDRPERDHFTVASGPACPSHHPLGRVTLAFEFRAPSAKLTGRRVLFAPVSLVRQDFNEWDDQLGL